MTAKLQLRTLLTQRLNRLSTADCCAASVAICDRLRTLSIVMNAVALAFYVPIKQEINLMPLAEEMLEARKTIAFPRYSAEKRAYEMAVITSTNDFIEGKFSIPEPDPQCAVWSAPNDCSRTVWFVPGLGFDADGHRLGRGGGYYDRLLNSKHTMVGIAHECQVVEAVPVDAHDVRMNMIVTDCATYTCDAITNS